ncbi:hypothetical protein D6U55_19750, partial [Vibrio cholerae]|nr:hypothetical protein [Vibrio cholerae]
RADTEARESEALDQTFQKFIDSNPPENFAAVASYERGLLLMDRRKNVEAARAFGLVAERYTNAVGETG